MYTDADKTCLIINEFHKNVCYSSLLYDQPVANPVTHARAQENSDHAVMLLHIINSYLNPPNAYSIRFIFYTSKRWIDDQRHLERAIQKILP